MNLLIPDGCAQVAVHCIRHGGSAHPRRISFHKESPVERYYRDAPLMIIGEGTNDIMRLLIAKQLLNLPQAQI